MPQPFHLAIPVHSLSAARDFYGQLFGCPEGRSSAEWVDFDFFGHQVVAHLDPNQKKHVHHNEVDGHDVPVPHFGVVPLTLEGEMRWQGAPFETPCCASLSTRGKTQLSLGWKDN